MHVDTLQTHVISAIVNVDQDVDSPWVLKMLSKLNVAIIELKYISHFCVCFKQLRADHFDEEVDLAMEPGDMVLYESAKLLHGRPGDFATKNYYLAISSSDVGLRLFRILLLYHIFRANARSPI